MAFFSNKDLNLLNVHYALRAFGWEMFSLLTLSYLYKQGLPLPTAFFVYGGMLCVRTLTRPLAMKLCLKKGIHYTLMLGTFVFACRYPVMIPIDSLNWWIVPFMFISGLSDVLYWVSYHNYFASAGSTENRGSAVGIREAIATIVAVLGPVCGTLLLNYNRVYAFSMAFVLTLLSLYPLIKTPELPLPTEVTPEEKKNVSTFGYYAFIGDGWFYQANAVWPLIVFMMLGENYTTFGFILGLAALFRAAGNLFFGSMIDKGKGRSIVFIGYGMHIVVACTRGFFAHSIAAVIACDFFAALAYCFSMPALMTAIYNETKRAKHTLYFTYYTELGWDIGAITVMAVCGILAVLNINIRWCLVLVVIGSVLKMFLLNRYYKKEPLEKKKLSVEEANFLLIE